VARLHNSHSSPDRQIQDLRANNICPATTTNNQDETHHDNDHQDNDHQDNDNDPQEHDNNSQEHEPQDNDENNDTIPPYFGHPPDMLDPNDLRIASINIDNLPPFREQPKDEALFQATADLEIDVLLLQETGINWSSLGQTDQFQSRLDNWFEPGQTSCYMSHNRQDMNRDVHQWGGTGVMAHDKIKHYSMGAGSDKAKLGRWTWARYRGQGGMVWRVVSIYQPCANKTGPLSVYSQHKRHLQNKNDDRDPRLAFRLDLTAELATWIDMGDTIVIAGDVNESVFHHSISDIFDQFHIRNLIFDIHDPSEAPKTYFRTAGGRIVDGLWGTPGVEVIRYGYLEPGDFPGNHSLMWADLTYSSILGHNPPYLKHPVPAASKHGTQNAPKNTSTNTNSMKPQIT
jgi:exonuclease III